MTDKGEMRQTMHLPFALYLICFYSAERIDGAV